MPKTVKDPSSTELPKSIVLEYFQLSQQYQKEYGSDTCLLYMVGSFYELYSIVHPTTQEVCDVTPISRVAEICHLNVAHKQATFGDNKALDTPFAPFPAAAPTPAAVAAWVKATPTSQVVMAGARDYSLDKYLDLLVNAGFTVVVYDQEKTKEEGRPEVIRRVLQNIYSPGTYVSPTAQTTLAQLSNHLLCVWIDRLPETSRRLTSTLVCGIAQIDMFTGEILLYEIQDVAARLYDEVDRILTTAVPVEIIAISNRLTDQEDDAWWVGSGMRHLSVKMHHIRQGHADTPPEVQTKLDRATKQTYMQAVLQLFQDSCQSPPPPSTGRTVYESCQEFQLHAMATQALCYLLDFVQEHNKTLVRKLQFPRFESPTQRMVLANRTLRQLNMVSSGVHDVQGRLSSVEAFFNRGSTPMGRRYLRHQLLHPKCDVSSLQILYDQIADLLQTHGQETLAQRRQQLAPIRDLEFLGRQIVTQKLAPAGLLTLVQSLERWLAVRPEPACPKQEVSDPAREIVAFVHSHIFLEQLSAAAGVTMPSSSHGIANNDGFIKPGVSPELDALVQEQQRLVETILHIQQWFEALIQDTVKWHETEKQGVSLQLTKKRANTLRAALAAKDVGDTALLIEITPEIRISKHEIKIVACSSTTEEITFPQLAHMTKALNHLKDRVQSCTQEVYRTFLQTLEDQWLESVVAISHEIAEWDALLTKAYLARKYHYCRPELVDNGGSSFVQSTDLRHPLIEHLQTRELYVANDVSLHQEGILLTGYNGIGKTSLIRSLGISVILAQAGFFVPCTTFRLAPYRAIYCHIEKQDNLFKNQSTFQLEMSELRTILKRADSHALVLGDELMNSTEGQSGLSIMMAVLETLCDQKASFVLATHFNQLADYEEIQALIKEDKLHPMHMSVTYDHTEQRLVYDRKLRPGMGTKAYGLEVARSLFLDPVFLARAFQLRNKYFPQEQGVLSMPTSHFSALKIRGMCEQCGARLGTETHHVLEQHCADADGFIGHVHKNHPANLKSVCEACHRAVHGVR